MTPQTASLILENLQHMQIEGEDTVYLSDASMAMLQNFKKAHPPKLEFKKTYKPKPAPKITLEEDAPKSKAAKPKAKSTPKHPPLPPAPEVNLPAGDKEAQWNYLKEQVLDCEECNKHVKPGKKVVFGVGNLNADIFFCGEAPGADEEIQGEPFVGPAGQLLTKIIQAGGLKREDVYIGNIMNWRPEMETAYGNRPPTQEEMSFCLPYLRAQLAIVQPKVIVALGSTAVHGLLGYDSKRRMGDVRGKWHSFEETPLMITFHPSYLLRNNTLRTKRLVWEDMLQVMEKVNLPISDKQRRFFP